MGTVLTFCTHKHTVHPAGGTGVLPLYPSMTVWRTGILTQMVSWAPQMTQVQPPGLGSHCWDTTDGLSQDTYIVSFHGKLGANMPARIEISSLCRLGWCYESSLSYPTYRADLAVSGFKGVLDRASARALHQAPAFCHGSGILNICRYSMLPGGQMEVIESKGTAEIVSRCMQS